MIIGKTTLIALSAFALPCASLAGLATLWPQEEHLVVDAASISINPANGLRLYEGEPFSGLAQKSHANGRLAESDSYYRGLRHGPSTIWFADGQKSYEMYFKEGQRDGTSRTWWSNGHLRSQTEFIADQQEGVAWSWYATGETYKRHFYKNGAPEGLQRAWRKNGKLYENFEIRNGKSYGLRNAKICVEVKEPDA